MHRYEKLEKLYYRKLYLKYLFIFFFVVIILGVFFVFLNFEKKQPIKSNHVVKAAKEKNTTKNIESNKTMSIPKIKEVKKLVLYPMFPDVDKLLKETNIKQEKNTTNKVEKPKKQEPKIQPKTEEVKPQAKEPALKIIVKPAKETLSSLLYLYSKSPEYDIAIKISKLYYQKKNFDKSIEWAKKANKMAPEKYESWYIFAQNLLAQNQKAKAKQVLIAYLNTYGNDKHILKLLDKIK